MKGQNTSTENAYSTYRRGAFVRSDLRLKRLAADQSDIIGLGKVSNISGLQAVEQRYLHS